jgi:hypothetical protein
MIERKKVREYREALHEMARPQEEAAARAWRARPPSSAAEILGEERKDKPETKGGAMPRR